jgi:serine protease
MRKNLLLIVTAFAVMMTGAMASNPNGHASQSRVALKPGSYNPGVALIKMKPETRGVCAVNSISVPSITEKLVRLGATSVNKMFVHSQPPTQTRNKAGQEMVDISLIYKIEFSVSMPMEEALALLRSDNSIEFAEPEYKHWMCYTPSDPSRTLQYHLNDATGGVHAYSAWDVTKGDTNVVIGIVDSGTDWDHPDLANNIKYNYADPIGGGDQDGDGYIDNYRGWDVSDNDNSPMVSGSTHGSHVSGCADAVTDNGTGVCGVGFKCKFLPVKVAHDASTTSIDNGFDGIVYAADHGCNVINLSWGRAGGPSDFEQTIINYAAVNHDIVVMAAAGNDGLDEGFYPATYANAVSIAATTNTDAKASFSNYGFNIDMCAPGNNIYATVANDTYTYMSGTSMASPIAAGCAAIVRSRFPAYTQEQVQMQLRATCDNIYGVTGNAAYANKLGKGRINLASAVNNTTTPGIAISIQSISDNNDNVFVGNDTLRIVMRFKNLLAASSAATSASIAAISTQVTLIGVTTFAVGALNTMDTISNYAVAWTYKVKPTAPVNTTVPFKVTVTDGSYSDFYAFNVLVNVDYINIEVNDISTSQTSKGRLGYNVSTTQGLGFKYLGSPTLLYEAGLMIGDGTHQLDNGVRNETAATDEDFAYNLRVTQQPSVQSDFYSYGIMNENGPTSSGSKMNILVSHNTWAWISAGNRNYVMVEYVIKNTGSSALNNVYAGIFADWDVPNVAATTDYSYDVDSVDVAHRLGYVRNTSSDGFWVATKLLSHTANFNHYAIDNVTGGNGGVDVTDADYFSEADKYAVMSTNRDFAGSTTPNGNDVADVTATGPLTIAAGDSVKVAFALLAGYDLASIQSGADAAQVKYDGMLLGIEPIAITPNAPFSVMPNPITNSSVVEFSVTKNSPVDISAYNVLGEKVKTILHDNLSVGTYNRPCDLTDLAAGSYVIRLDVNGKSEVRRVIVK